MINTKKFIYASLAVFALIFVYDWVVHGMLLQDAYRATANLWRPEDQMFDYFHWMVGGQALVAIMFCFIFAKGYEGRGIMEGVRYGIYIGLLFNAVHLMMYAVAPYPITLVYSWIGATFGEMILAGVVASLVYKR